MKSGPDIAMVAALVGDPARANMLTALLSGKALTASELAQEAGVTRYIMMSAGMVAPDESREMLGIMLPQASPQPQCPCLDTNA